MPYFLLVLLLLGLGTLASRRISWLDRFRIPPSLTTGILTLLFFTLFPAEKSGNFFVHLRGLPAEFIALVFACLFLQAGESEDHSRRSFREVFAQVSLVWLSVMGQVVIGLVATILVFKPFFSEPMAFTSVLETGFAGGHGTAVAMGPILVQNGIAGGLEYGLFSATVGLVCGIAGGLWLIRHEHRRHAAPIPAQTDTAAISLDLPALFTSAMLIAAAYWLGTFLKGALEQELLPRMLAAEKLRGFSLPLFAYTLVGGYAVKTACRLSGAQSIIHNAAILLLADVFLEILIFAGIAIIDVRLLGHSLVPLLGVFALGFAWNLFCHFYIRPKVLPVPYSFELGIINFGMLNGTAATGLMLLKMVDPKFKTPAARVFAQSSAITQPFIAGGLLTLLTPFIVTGLPAWLSMALYGGLLMLWLLLALAAGRRIRQASNQTPGARRRREYPGR